MWVPLPTETYSIAKLLKVHNMQVVTKESTFGFTSDQSRDDTRFRKALEADINVNTLSMSEFPGNASIGNK